MAKYLALTSVLVNDYDEAIGYYVDKLGFDLIEDTPTVQSNAPEIPK